MQAEQGCHHLHACGAPLLVVASSACFCLDDVRKYPLCMIICVFLVLAAVSICQHVRVCPQANAPVTSAWDARLARYLRAAETFTDQAQHHDSDFVRVDATMLAAAAKDEALTWLRMLIKAMRTADAPDFAVRS